MRVKKRVAVEDSLTPVWNELEDEGFEPVALDEADLDEVDAVVLSGEHDDIMGIETTETGAPVIVAEGLTPREVVQRLRTLER